MADKQSAKESLFDTGRRTDFDAVSIGLASPETIRSWSYGEVKNPETINYRTYKPEKGGLFCERIFGPQRDWECSCGKYKRIKHKGVVCDRCGVEVTYSRVRRERMGHIELAVPVSHIWFFKCTPSRIGLVLDMGIKTLERVLYYEDYIVVDPGKTPLKERQVLTEEEYRKALKTYGEEFSARMGAEAVRDVMKRLDLEQAVVELEEEMRKTKSQHTTKKLAKRLKLLESMRTAHMRPEWMVLEVLPVIPPDLRPLVPLEGGRFACSDLNDLYRRVINRNNRLKNLLMLKTPEVIIRNEKRMLQEAVDALLDNGRHGRPVTGSGNRPLKSLSDMLKGKQGRFRQNLLGKRVDYSGRSVVVVGPELQIRQCGLPKKMALVLFEPFIIRRLKEKGIIHTVRSAKKLIESQCDEVWDALDEVIKGKTVFLNRAPTLHRLSVQAFEPVLIEGDAIQIHPLVCTAFNADFDGDQMAVHVPLSVEAQLESRMLMLSINNLFSPSSGRPILMPTQDILLGLYYLTMDPVGRKVPGPDPAPGQSPAEHYPVFGDADEVKLACELGRVNVHTVIRFRNPDYLHETVYGLRDRKTITTTVGRVFFNAVFPHQVGFFNRTSTKKDLSTLIWRCQQASGSEETIRVLDRLKELGFEYATLTGVSIALVDMEPSPDKASLVAAAQEQIETVEKQYRKGIITGPERYNKVTDIWNHTTDEISASTFRAMERNRGTGLPNPLFMMVDSGARGSRKQIHQLAGMRGLMSKPSGDIIEQPIISCFREGLSVLEYFISTHGARKGLADTALKTADAGYLTRKLVDVSQDVIISEQDCNTMNGIEISAIESGNEDLIALEARLMGRTALDDVRDPGTQELIVAAGHDIGEAEAKRIAAAAIEKVKIRSVLTCESRRGVCAKCYGRDLTTGRQLTMRTFHVGGTATILHKQIRAKNAGRLDFGNAKVIRDLHGNSVVMNKKGWVSVRDKDGRELEKHMVVRGAVLSVENGGTVHRGQVFGELDPSSVPIIAEHSGQVHFQNFIEGETVKTDVDQTTGLKGIRVLDHREEAQPQVTIRDERGVVVATYPIPSGAHVVVQDGATIQAGAILAKTPRKTAKTKDITAGLPRVAELFEARRPKDAAEISRIAGVVELRKDQSDTQRGRRRLLLVRDVVSGETEEHWIPIGKHIIVFNGDYVEKGEPLTEGPVVPQEILDVCGPQALQEYLVNEIQHVYRHQGVEINDKHIEIIVRQMLRKVRVTDSGDTEFLMGEQVDKNQFHEINRLAVAEGKRPAQATPALLGVTRASIETESFISAASFQETTRVLTEAATLGKVDRLRGFKENVIMGHLIPAGVGFPSNKHIKLVPLAAPEAPVPTPPSEPTENKLITMLKNA
jgi:DNA-directed RNA polymerase subunit beta'